LRRGEKEGLTTSAESRDGIGRNSIPASPHSSSRDILPVRTQLPFHPQINS